MINYGSVLMAAAFWGNEIVVRLLLEKGVHINAQRSGRYGNALTTAALWGTKP